MGSENLKACVIIPARYASTRFPGKPLVPLLGKPMIIWVAERASEAVGINHVFIATDDYRIAETVNKAGFRALMTSTDALTGTDRIAEVANLLDYEIFINVQGDEPLVHPEDIQECITLKMEQPELVVNGYCWIGENEQPSNRNLPKVVTNESDELIYMSRAPLPSFKDQLNTPERYKKQVCIYGFSKLELKLFSQFGRKSYLERLEDIEILRFFELGIRIKMFECTPGLAVDIPADVEPVENALKIV